MKRTSLLDLDRTAGGRGSPGTDRRPHSLIRRVEEDLAVVRGTRHGRPGATLLRLERSLHRPEDRPAHRHPSRRDLPPGDAGAPVDVTYSGPLPTHAEKPATATPITRAIAASREHWLADIFPPRQDGRPLAYHIEPYPAETVVPEATAGSTQAPEAREVGAEHAAPPAGETPTAAGPAPGKRAPAATPPGKAPVSSEITGFQEDLARLIADAGRVRPAPAHSPSREHVAERSDESGSPAEPAPPGRGHEIFDRLGGAMRYANTFDLGSMDLRQHFEALDRAMEESPDAATVQSPGEHPPLLPPGDLDDLDILADLAELQAEGPSPDGEEETARPDVATRADLPGHDEPSPGKTEASHPPMDSIEPETPDSTGHQP